VARIIVLDSWPLGLASNDPQKPDVARCLAWIPKLDMAGAYIFAPEIADFEVRRESLRVGIPAGIQRLDALLADLSYAPITRPTMRLAAEYWAHVRGGPLIIVAIRRSFWKPSGRRGLAEGERLDTSSGISVVARAGSSAMSPAALLPMKQGAAQIAGTMGHCFQ
jgi:hypothetical protein